MKLRLKDKNLQNRLDRFTNGEFSKNLQQISDLTKDGSFVGVMCGDRIPDLDIKTPGGGIPALRFSFHFNRDEIEEVPGITSEEMKANIREQIGSLRGILNRIENDIDEDEPVAAEVRVGLAKGLVGSLDMNIKEWMRKEEDA